MQIAVCDDSQCALSYLAQQLKEYCRAVFIPAEIFTYASGDLLLQDFTAGRFELIFLDIYMKGTDGIETARQIRERDAACSLVFVTMSRAHALAGFSVNALHYLLKPVSFSQLAEVFSRCPALTPAKKQMLQVISDRISLQIPLPSIRYIEVYDKACFLHTENQTIKTYMSLDDIMKQLDGDFFIRCHRSYVVNLQAVSRIAADDFVLADETHIPIRQAEKQQIKKRYMNFCVLWKDHSRKNVVYARL